MSIFDFFYFSGKLFYSSVRVYAFSYVVNLVPDKQLKYILIHIYRLGRYEQPRATACGSWKS